MSGWIVEDSPFQDNNQLPRSWGSTAHSRRRSQRNERKSHQSRRSSLETQLLSFFARKSQIFAKPREVIAPRLPRCHDEVRHRSFPRRNSTQGARRGRNEGGGEEEPRWRGGPQGESSAFPTSREETRRGRRRRRLLHPVLRQDDRGGRPDGPGPVRAGLEEVQVVSCKFSWVGSLSSRDAFC